MKTTAENLVRATGISISGAKALLASIPPEIYPVVAHPLWFGTPSQNSGEGAKRKQPQGKAARTPATQQGAGNIRPLLDSMRRQRAGLAQGNPPEPISCTAQRIPRKENKGIGQFLQSLDLVYAESVRSKNAKQPTKKQPK